MNTTQRAVLFTAALALLAMIYWLPCKDGSQMKYVSLWTMYWGYRETILVSFLLTQLAFVATLTTMLVLAFKSRN